MTIIRGGHVLFYALLLFAFFQNEVLNGWGCGWVIPPPPKKNLLPHLSPSRSHYLWRVLQSAVHAHCPGPSAFPYLWITQIYVALHYLASFLVTRNQRESAIKRRECPPLEFIKWSHGFYFISSSVRGTVWGCWCKEPSPTRYSTIFIQNILQTKIKSLKKTLICLQDPLIIKMIRNISQHDGVTKCLFVEFIGKKRLFF